MPQTESTSELATKLFQKVVQDLKQQRDELKLQIHLGGAEMQDRWNALESKLLQLSDRFELYNQRLATVARDSWEALKLSAEEIKDGFQRIRDDLHELKQKRFQ